MSGKILFKDHEIEIIAKNVGITTPILHPIRGF